MQDRVRGRGAFTLWDDDGCANAQDRVRDKEEALRALRDDLRGAIAQHRIAEEKREASEASLTDRCNNLEHR